MKKRKIITIDEELCDGCGDCITACAEGALALVDGKARRLITDLGDASGYVAVGDNVLFAGGAFGKFPDLTNKVFAFSLAEVRAALASGKPLSAKTDDLRSQVLEEAKTAALAELKDSDDLKELAKAEARDELVKELGPPESADDYQYSANVTPPEASCSGSPHCFASSPVCCSRPSASRLPPT